MAKDEQHFTMHAFVDDDDSITFRFAIGEETADMSLEMARKIASDLSDTIAKCDRLIEEYAEHLSGMEQAKKGRVQ